MIANLSKLLHLSFSDLPQTDSFFLSLAAVFLLVPPFVIFFAWPLLKKIMEMRYFLLVRPIIHHDSIRNFDYWKDEKSVSVKNRELFQGEAGNFLSLVSGLKKVLLMTADKISDKKINAGMTFDEINSILEDENFFSNCGRKKIKLIEWLYMRITTGELKGVSKNTIRLGVCVAWDLNQEVNNWLALNKEKNKITN